MLIAALLSLTLAGPADPDPLAPAREGMAQCYRPNKATRTCGALATYEFHADGTITNYAELALLDEPLVIVRSAAPVYVRDGAECSDVDPRTIDFKFEIDGQPADAATAAELRELFLQAIDQNPDGLYCTTYHSNGDGTLTGRVTIDGERWPDGDDTLLWVNPAEGWKVAL